MFTGYLRHDETIVKRSQPSRAAIVIRWLSIPSMFFFYYIVTLPARLKAMVISSVTEEIQEELGMGGSGFSLELLPFEIPAFVKVLIVIPVIILVLAWLGWALVSTFRQLKNGICLTNSRLLAISGSDMLIVELGELKNASSESSLWGHFFGYGDLNIVTKSGGITVKAISDALEWQRTLRDIIDDL